MLYFYCSTCSGKGEKGMLSTKRWNIIFKISGCILCFIIVLLMIVGSNILDLLYFGIMSLLILSYVVDKKLK